MGTVNEIRLENKVIVILVCMLKPFVLGILSQQINLFILWLVPNPAGSAKEC